MEKAQLRTELKRRLVQIAPDERIAKSKAICGFILESEAFDKAAVVMLFLSLPHEVDTTSLILSAWQRGKTVVVPKMSWEQRRMIPVEIDSLETGLKTDQMGLRNPTSGVPVPFEDIDLVVTPGLGFDRQGNRLVAAVLIMTGFFYRMKYRAVKWGVCFSEQLCPEIPHTENDVPMDAVVTEQGVIRCSPE